MGDPRYMKGTGKNIDADNVNVYDRGTRSMASYPVRPTFVQKIKEQTLDKDTAEELERARAMRNPKGD